MLNNELYFYVGISIAFLICFSLAIKYKWNFLVYATLNFMQEVESNYNKKGGGKEKLQEVIDLLQLKFKFLNFIPDRYIISFVEYVFNKFKDKIHDITKNKEIVAVETANKIISKACKIEIKDPQKEDAINKLKELNEEVKNDYRGFIQAEANTDFKDNTSVGVRVGYKW